MEYWYQFASVYTQRSELPSLFPGWQGGFVGAQSVAATIDHSEIWSPQLNAR